MPPAPPASPQPLADQLAALAPAGLPAGAAALLAGIAAAPPTPAGYSGVALLGEVEPALSRQIEALTRAQAQRYAEAVERRGAGAGRERLAALRAELERRGLDGFIVPLNDEYHGEYVPRHGQRLAWLTGFTGSAGVALVLAESAAFFTDGRYTLQAGEQVDGALYAIHHIVETPPSTWLARHLSSGQRFGYDPWLHTGDGLARLDEACAAAQAELVAVESNPLDAVWTDQPPPPLSPVKPHPLDYAGEASADKRRRLAAALAERGRDCTILTLPESLAWLLNVRGGDVPRTPLPLSFGILHADAGVDWFIDQRKLTPATRAHLDPEVRVHELASFAPALDALGEAGAAVQVDPASAPAAVLARLTAQGARLHRAEDPCLLPKACKNAIELAGSREAHRRDGVALVRFLAWLDQALTRGEVVDELGAAARLESFRRENALFQDLSFDTISGAGPNGAIVHYRVTPASSRPLAPGQRYLLDSGAQYLDGTTDVTRTIAIGTPTAEMCDRFSRVLKGHIALALCQFPEGTSGGQLDILARQPLWQAGLDYDHGTGHGVGSYLSVHEGPQRVAKAGSAVPLKRGMILSDEPGYYKAGHYGIRIENLVAVVEAPPPLGAERTLLAFETLTRVPIDRRLVDPMLLGLAEMVWLDNYHAALYEELAPLLDAESGAWLEGATRPIGD